MMTSLNKSAHFCGAGHEPRLQQLGESGSSRSVCPCVIFMHTHAQPLRHLCLRCATDWYGHAVAPAGVIQCVPTCSSSLGQAQGHACG